VGLAGLEQRPHPETKIARVPTGSAAREPSLAGRPDSHPSWRPPAMAALSAIEGSALCGPPFPQVTSDRQGRRDAFVATLVQAVQARRAVLRPSSDEMKSSRWWLRHPHASIKTRRHRRPLVTSASQADRQCSRSGYRTAQLAGVSNPALRHDDRATTCKGASLVAGHREGRTWLAST